MSTTERKGIDMPNNHDDEITIPQMPVTEQGATRVLDALMQFDATGRDLGGEGIDVRSIAVEMVQCQAEIAQAQTRLFELNKQLLDALLV